MEFVGCKVFETPGHALDKLLFITKKAKVNTCLDYTLRLMFSSKCAFPCLKKGCWNSMTELFSAVIIPFSRAITFLKPSVERY